MKRSIIIAVGIVVIAAGAVIVAVQLMRTPSLTDANGNPPVPVVENDDTVPSEDVPAHIPPSVSTPGLAKVIDRSLSVEERAHGLASGEITEVKNPGDLKALAGVLSDPKEGEVIRNEIASLLKRSGYAGLESLLFQIIENPEESQKFRSWAVQHVGGLLTDRHDIPVSDDLVERIRKLLTDPDVHVRRQALQLLVWADDAKALESIPAIINSEASEDQGMRDLAIRFAKDKDMRDQIPVIRTLTSSTNEIIRIAAIRVLGEWRDVESRPAMETALKDGSLRVKRCAQLALKELDKPKAAESRK